MAVKEFPTVIEVDLVDTAQSTFCGRCTDAVRSVLNNQWPTDIDLERLREIAPGLYVVPKDASKARVGPRDFIEKIKVITESEFYETHPQVIRTGRTVLELTGPTDEEITAALILANRNFFRGTPVHLYEISNDQKLYIDTMQYAAKYPNVVFDGDPNNAHHYTLL